MRYYASDIDSFLYYQRNGRWAVEHAQIAEVSSIEDCVSHPSDLFRLDLDAAGLRVPWSGMPGSLCPMAGESGKRHVLVSGSVNRHRCNGLSRNLWGGPVPPGSFAQIGTDVYASTPGFCFLQLARRLTLAQLVLVGCSLCGGYYVSPQSEVVLRSPVTSTDEIGAYLDGAKGVRGLGLARRALSLVADGAESPQEVNSYLLTCLPKELGGCGVGKLSLNYVIPVEPEDAAILDKPERKAFRIDMGDPLAHVGSEYLGKGHERTAEEDRARLNALTAKGEKILQVKYCDLVDPRLSERHAQQLAQLLGVSLSERTLAEEEALGRLRSFLFGSDRPCI